MTIGVNAAVEKRHESLAQEVAMKMMVLLALMTFGLGLMGTSQLMAAPANGSAIGEAAATVSSVSNVRCVWRQTCARGRCVSRRVCW